MDFVQTYHIFPKYWDTLNTYHACPKIWKSPFYYLLMFLKYCLMIGKQYRPWANAAFCNIWSGSTLFVQAYLSQYLGLLWYLCVLIRVVLASGFQWVPRISVGVFVCVCVCVYVCVWFFSSPELKAQGELLWSLTVRRRRHRPYVRPSVRPSTIFKQHLLLNHWLDFDQTSQEWSLVGPLSKLFKWFWSIAYLGRRS